ncbi:DUF4224 domain-containing protein [Xanthomonas rydalmerensis]|uniref:DUF4224 domain-containing protein n=1 Tax=Xanthomonas rydalmerensis TaxID=3046274 RepID=A0ABZ0JMQ4_9XANT|nr:DUF4224 domain-containing protein [Xanthomonas sp. DM-2023]WOS40663.1 DUF4224 domain-containing protein [Xanthomonas sp. DM-2023]WOS44847.1 DUF4224 domain-containing protein [Xanthomonas sp. DM-2023]WOS49027.1 DUF4224 domain-containing protein [Xanthomonas sp. DM-2023]WOS53207.1 DUF4224 domain-containing protein [Xanthomonas sp. DM-2023]WOS57390.1 DUF4224 domain-containing protein [Xanthomonas sp. DM-2023]
MSQLCLSRDEIAELCRSPQRARQARFLQQNGIRHYLDAHGWPVVLRSAVEPTEKQKPSPPAWKSNKVP